jgi:ATP-dependent protease ClpP protease subunit
MPKKYYSLVTNADQSTADLYIFGDITSGWSTAIDEAWGWDTGDVSGLSIVKELRDVSADTINVHINSMGGLTAEGLAIYNTLKNHSAKVVTMVDGFACSAASLIFMAGDERIMGDASLLMIHNAWMTAQGNAHQLRATAEELDKISEAAANAYASKINISREELDALLDGSEHDGTWISPEEAVEMGFATSIDKTSADGINQSAMSSLMRRMNSTAAQKADPDLKEIIRQTVEETVKAMSEPSLTVRDGNISSLYASSADITISNDYIKTSKDIIAEPEQKSLASRLFNMKKEKNNA